MKQRETIKNGITDLSSVVGSFVQFRVLPISSKRLTVLEQQW